MNARTRRRQRVSILYPAHATLRQQRELGAFVRYCIGRVERDLGEYEAWYVAIAPSARTYSSRIQVEGQGTCVEGHGSSGDPTLSIWAAMCHLEERLRENRGLPPMRDVG